MLKALDISTSGLVSQRIRLNAIASNVANASSLRNEDGEVKPFQERYVVFQPDEELKTSEGAMGVKVGAVRAEQVEPNYRYDPGHPMAVQEGEWKGYVAYPNIDMMSQFVDSLVATRAYEANLGVMEITKSMSQRALQIIA
ncbi:MAG: flagellar basal body rod protein FlgC [Planctomycetota bacterium]